jgi:glycosyltransferase involved in cell wall biosynthesis
MKKIISIITPTFNEELNIEKLCLEISRQMSGLDYDYEHLIIDNSSTDKTQQIVKKLCDIDKRIKAIFNVRNFGHLRSPFYGLLQCKGDAVIFIASDFQDPIELIPSLIQKWSNGHEVVLLQKNSSDESFIINFLRKLFYKFINLISDIDLTINTTGSGIFDKKIINILKLIDEPYPYFRGLISEISKKVETIPFNQPKRKYGKSKNNFYTLYDVAMLGIIKHSKIPLRVTTIFGFICSAVSLIIGLFFFIYKILYWNSFQLGMAPVIIGIFFGIAIQVFLLGIIGEYVGFILTQSRKMPLVIEKERINFN